MEVQLRHIGNGVLGEGLAQALEHTALSWSSTCLLLAGRDPQHSHGAHEPIGSIGQHAPDMWHVVWWQLLVDLVLTCHYCAKQQSIMGITSVIKLDRAMYVAEAFLIFVIGAKVNEFFNMAHMDLHENITQTFKASFSQQQAKLQTTMSYIDTHTHVHTSTREEPSKIFLGRIFFCRWAFGFGGRVVVTSTRVSTWECHCE
eukprot:4973830-Amphidinium_carterae.1